MTGLSVPQFAGEASSSSAAASEYAVQAVHEASYLEFLRFAPSEQGGIEIKATLHPGEDMMRLPGHIEARAGFYIADATTVVSAETWPAVFADAQAAVEGAVRLLAGEKHVSVRCRTRGRHAQAGRAGRGCYLNHAAIAASHLRESLSRVAVLSLGEHHANGTQSILLSRGDILSVSVHRDPADCYPFYTGYSDEHGEGEGEGANLNLVLRPDAEGRDVESVLRQAREQIGCFAPDAVVIDMEGGSTPLHERLQLSGLGVVTRLSEELQQAILVISCNAI
ncbi:hypothetical protein AB4099_27815 [Bosea sp. 2KB_26]|uniref:hypothetical protein n=1 Tax=Bosea sp. 2KB_26 TaxID=3237475 RepID=UPI003F8DD9DD